jgi:hypothetical protein
MLSSIFHLPLETQPAIAKHSFGPAVDHTSLFLENYFTLAAVDYYFLIPVYCCNPIISVVTGGIIQKMLELTACLFFSFLILIVTPRPENSFSLCWCWTGRGIYHTSLSFTIQRSFFHALLVTAGHILLQVVESCTVRERFLMNGIPRALLYGKGSVC